MGENDPYEYFNPDLESKIFATLKEIKKKGEQAHVTVKCGTYIFQAHRLFLSIAIPYFRETFHNDETKKEIILRHLDPGALSCLINYCYTSRVKIPRAKVEALLLASEFLGITEIIEVCCSFLSIHLSTRNVIRIQQLAKNLMYTDLSKSAAKYIERHIDTVCRTDEFLMAPFCFVYDLIKKDDMATRKKEIIVEAAKKWIAKDSERFRYLRKLSAWIPTAQTPLSFHLRKKVPKKKSLRITNLKDEARSSSVLPKTVLKMKSSSLRYQGFDSNSLMCKPLYFRGNLSQNVRPRTEVSTRERRQCCSKSCNFNPKAFIADTWSINKSADDWRNDEGTFDNDDEWDGNDYEDEYPDDLSSGEIPKEDYWKTNRRRKLRHHVPCKQSHQSRKTYRITCSPDNDVWDMDPYVRDMDSPVQKSVGDMAVVWDGYYDD